MDSNFPGELFHDYSYCFFYLIDISFNFDHEAIYAMDVNATDMSEFADSLNF